MLGMMLGLPSLHANAASAAAGLRVAQAVPAIQADYRHHHWHHRRWDHGRWHYWD
jgi:hypothetical protein